MSDILHVLSPLWFTKLNRKAWLHATNPAIHNDQIKLKLIVFLRLKLPYPFQAKKQKREKTSGTQGNLGRDPFNQNFRKFRSNRKSFEKTGPPFEVDRFSRSDRSEILVEWIALLDSISAVSRVQSTVWAHFPNQRLRDKRGRGKGYIQSEREKASVLKCNAFYFEYKSRLRQIYSRTNSVLLSLNFGDFGTRLQCS